jgi:hypothetical protein
MAFTTPYQANVIAFETALKEELSTIPELANKVYPLNASRDVAAPYLVYLTNSGLPDKTLDGYLESKEVVCELNVIHPTYGGMKALSNSVLMVILSFIGRGIGTGQFPVVQDVAYDTVEIHEPEIKAFRCNIQFQVFLQ